MSLRDDIPWLLSEIKKQNGFLENNKALFDIYEGDLLTHVLGDLKQQLSPASFEGIKHRVAPINFLRRIIDKLKIYSKAPSRTLVYPDGSPAQDKDVALFSDLQKQMMLDIGMSLSNEFFNLFKNSFVEPYAKDGKAKLRIIPSDRFIVASKDIEEPTNPTHYVKFMGNITIPDKDLRRRGKMKNVDLFFAYTNDEFIAFTNEGEVQDEYLVNNGGVNIYGKIPGVYINRSHHLLTPKPDTDMLKMTKIIPVLCSDLNMAVMYQSFSVIFGIDINDENLVMSPNAFWRLKSDPTSGHKPEIGTIKPEVNITEVMNFIVAQLSFWLQSKSIRPGTIGQLSSENFASGVSKIVDEMDTFEERQKEVPFFEDAETKLFDLVAHTMWPKWKEQGKILDPRDFSEGIQCMVQFPDQKPADSRILRIEEQTKEFQAGFTTLERALRRLNPSMTEAEIEQLELDIIEERNTALQVDISSEDVTDEPGDNV